MINSLFESAQSNQVVLSAEQNRAILETATTLSTLSNDEMKQLLAEADLSPSDAARIFKTAVAMRSEKGLATKAKDAYVNSAEKIGNISKQIKSKLSKLVQASEPTTRKLIDLIQQGGSIASETIDIIDSKLDSQLLKTRNAARQLPRSYAPVSAEISEIEKVAKGSPQYGAFAVSSLASAENMMKRNVSVPAIILYLTTVSEVMKGKKLSTALQQSIKDMGPADTASVNESDFDDEFDMQRMRQLAGVENVNEKFGFGDKPELDYDELLTAWNRKGRPTDTDEIKSILSNAGLSKREISKAFKKADVDPEEGSNEQVTRVANALKKADLASYVIDYLEDMYPKEISESAQLAEAVIADSEIKKALLRVSRVYGTKDQSQTKSVKKYLQRWSREFNSADAESKESIAAEMVNYLSDRKSYDEYQDAVSAVSKIIRNSDLDEKVKKNILDTISAGKLYKQRKTVRQEKPAEKPRAQVTGTSGSKPKVRVKSKNVESMTLEELQKLFEDAIVRDMKTRYGRIKREAL